jgi:hypothetical protein
MKCLRCGHLNPDNAKTCESCSFDLLDSQPAIPKAKTSKMAILSLLLGISSLFFFVITGIPAIILGNISNIRIKRRKDRLKGQLIAIVSIFISLLFMFIFFLLWRLDAPPIPNDYTVADLRSAPPRYALSYNLLKQLTDPNFRTSALAPNCDVPPLGLSQEDFRLIHNISSIIYKGIDSEIQEIIVLNVQGIEQAWARAEKARDIIQKLNEFPEIDDSTEARVSVKPLQFYNLMLLNQLYEIYSYLPKEQNEIDKFVSELIGFDNFIKKLNVNIRSLYGKAACIACIKTNILLANKIINNKSASQKSIELLADQFKPLTDEQFSYRNAFIDSYLLHKDIVAEAAKESKNIKNPFFKKNSTLRLYWNYCNYLINTYEDMNDKREENLSAWPFSYPFKEPYLLPKFYEKLPLLYRCYNPGGSLIIQMFDALSFEYLPNEKMELKIQDNLLQIVLNKRLGKNVDLKALAYSDEYIVDIENKKIFSPGPDGKNGTKDDIKLQINPEVLGLTK